MDDNAAAVKNGIQTRIRRTMVLLNMTFIGIVILSFGLFAWHSGAKYQKIALGDAQSFFNAVLAMRAWNAEHGGIYLPVSEKFQPNPYLDDPSRDLLTTDGFRLTKVNPAFMTRMLAGYIHDKTGILIHITSMKPLNPGNVPDAWEKDVLTTYEVAGRPSWTFAEQDGMTTFRYLDGLRVEESCLRCHAKQGYSVGDVRGGISVSIPWEPFARAKYAEFLRLAALHGFFLLLGLGLLRFTGARLIRSVDELEASRAKVRTLEGLLPICSYCKRIRREGGDPENQEDWEVMEQYITGRARVDFSHSICPRCLNEKFPEDCDD